MGGKRKTQRQKRGGWTTRVEKDDQVSVPEEKGSQFIIGHNFHQNTFIVHAHSYSIQARLGQSFRIGLARDTLDLYGRWSLSPWAGCDTYTG